MARRGDSMPLNLIIQEPALGAAWALAILFAMSIHECAHAVLATALGDSTAKDAGRLTLNPLAHVDLFGFVMLLLIGFGWGRPVPFDASQLRNRRWGPAMVALAGPFANLVGLVLAGLALGVLDRTGALAPNNLLVFFLGFFFQINLVLLLFNCIPIPPLDGSKLLFGILDHPRFQAFRYTLEQRGPLLLLGLIILDSSFGGPILGRGFHAILTWVAGFF